MPSLHFSLGCQLYWLPVHRQLSTQPPPHACWPTFTSPSHRAPGFACGGAGQFLMHLLLWQLLPPGQVPQFNTSPLSFVTLPHSVALEFAILMSAGCAAIASLVSLSRARYELAGPATTA